jgi:dienelactone hydrolase
MTVASRDLRFDVLGKSYTGYLADGSDGAKVPGILVAHEGRGFTQHPRDRADMLAELGFVAFAPDYFGEAAHSLEHAFTLMEPFNADRTLFHTHGEAALDVLKRHPHVDADRLGAIGFCWGGFAVLELACAGELRAVVGFHPGLSLGPLSNPANIRASILICVGDRDPYVPEADIAAFMDVMRTTHVDCQVLLLLGAPHSFTNPEPYAYELGTDGVGYDAVADRRAWSAMKNHFAEAFGS